MSYILVILPTLTNLPVILKSHYLRHFGFMPKDKTFHLND